MAPSQSKLLSLPGELRNIIYKYALTSDEQPVSVGARSSHLVGIGLLRTNRQLYKETRPLLYEYNTLRFGPGCSSHLIKVARAVRPHQQVLKSVVICWGSRYRRAEFNSIFKMWRDELRCAIITHPIRIRFLEIHVHTNSHLLLFADALRCIRDVERVTVTGSIPIGRETMKQLAVATLEGYITKPVAQVEEKEEPIDRRGAAKGDGDGSSDNIDQVER